MLHSGTVMHWAGPVSQALCKALGFTAEPEKQGLGNYTDFAVGEKEASGGLETGEGCGHALWGGTTVGRGEGRAAVGRRYT